MRAVAESSTRDIGEEHPAEKEKNTLRRKKGPNAYLNKKSGYSYNIDKGGSYGRGGKKKEAPHVDVNYPNPKPKNVPSKKKLEVKSE